jgi:predicted nucleic acid-binding protein
MIVFLDANPVISFIEQPAVWGTIATARIAALRVAGHLLAVSDLVRMECQVGPLKAGDAVRLNAFLTFFASRDVNVLPVTAGVCDRAARIRATCNLKPLDSLHLAAAVEHGCGLFLTADARLARFPDIAVEVPI